MLWGGEDGLVENREREGEFCGVDSIKATSVEGKV